MYLGNLSKWWCKHWMQLLCHGIVLFGYVAPLESCPVHKGLLLRWTALLQSGGDWYLIAALVYDFGLVGLPSPSAWLLYICGSPLHDAPPLVTHRGAPCISDPKGSLLYCGVHAKHQHLVVMWGGSHGLTGPSVWRMCDLIRSSGTRIHERHEWHDHVDDCDPI